MRAQKENKDYWKLQEEGPYYIRAESLATLLAAVMWKIKNMTHELGD